MASMDQSSSSRNISPIPNCSASQTESSNFDRKTTLVTWNSSSDPENPKNWSLTKKWLMTMIISSFAFLAPLSSSISAPALSDIGVELHIPTASQTNMVLSIFLLAYTFGPFVLSPCSEIWGRTWIIQGGNLFFLFFNTACGFSRTQGQLTTFRFLAGLGGSATVGIGSGVLSDCWSAEERGRGMSVYQLAPVLGPALAPIAGGFIAQYTTWRWTFWSVSCLSVAIQIVALAFVQETYAPRILGLKARKLRREHKDRSFQTEWDNITLKKLLSVSLTRPWLFLLTQPIIQILALYSAFNWGMLYLLIASMPKLWEEEYGMSKQMASLHYLALLGSLVASQLFGPINDRIHSRLHASWNLKASEVVPEFRIPLMIPASLLTVMGIFLFGWAPQANAHWLFADIGIALFAGGSLICYLCISMYLVDTYTEFAASASAASALLRSLAAFTFPLFAPNLFHDLGYGLGCTVLGSVAVVLGIPAPILLWKYGARLRGSSLYTRRNK